METISRQIGDIMQVMQMESRTRSKTKGENKIKQSDDEIKKLLAEPVQIDKGGQIKIAGSKLEGIMLIKRMRRGLAGAGYKRLKLDEEGEACIVPRREGNMRYAGEESMDFRTPAIEKCRDDNDNPESFFTNEFCQVCN